MTGAAAVVDWQGAGGPAIGGAAASEPEPVVELSGVLKRRAGGEGAFELAVPRLALRPGQAVACVGPSGSGKSTLIDILAMTLKPDQASRFRFVDPRNGRPIDVMALWRQRRLDDLARLRGRAFGYVLQTGGLLPFLTVADNIALPQRLLGMARPALIAALTRRLGIDALGNRLPASLSVGQRQRVAIARALAHAPSIVLADEPTASLDPVNAVAVMDLFMELIETSGVALVIATHDAGLVARYGLAIVEGRVSEHGSTTRSVFGADPAAEAL